VNELILGTVDFLRDTTVGLSLGAEACDEQPDGQPPPWDGETYYAVCEGEWTNDADEYLGEYMGLEITITLRAGYAPVDRLNVELKRRLRTLAAQLRAKLHSSENHMVKVNARLAGTEQQFVEPIRFRGFGKITPRGPDWFWAEADAETQDAPSGLSITGTFARARRVQGLDGPMT
jgi:hypothetical protein